MKKKLQFIITGVGLCIALSLSAQKTDYKAIAKKAEEETKQELAAKKDTTVQITLPLDTYRQLLYVIDANIDSKKLSKEISDLLQKSTIILKEGKKD